MGKLDGKAAVTGVARGIGHATVELFADEGATVYATDINAPRSPFESERVHFATVEVADENAWQILSTRILSEHRSIDVLVNNADIGGSQLPLADEAPDSSHRVIAVNQTGVFLEMRAVLPAMRAPKSDSIVNISSIWGSSAARGAAAYHASKAAVSHLTKHVNYGAENIRANSVHQGIVGTPMVLVDQAEEISAAVIAATPPGHMGRPDELASGVLFLARDDSSFMAGAELVIDGGYLAQ
jgi:NAD(P)-dependent dehydrogenase (short-subunit alcohol dehydrogenase family)